MTTPRAEKCRGGCGRSTRTANLVCSECQNLQDRAKSGEVDLFGNPTIAPSLAPMPSHADTGSLPIVEETSLRTHKLPEFGITSAGIKVRIEGYGICNGVKGWWVKDLADHLSKAPIFVPRSNMTRAFYQTGSN